MRRIVVDMHNRLFTDAVARALRGGGSDFLVQQTDSPDEDTEVCRVFHPYALLLEVTRHEPWTLAARLKIRNEVKKAAPDCKIVFICDENTENTLAEDVRQAKKDGLIDQFVYGSVSTTYLVAVMDTL